MTGSGIPIVVARVEGEHLVALIDQFLELLRDTEIGADAALDRLTPAVYPGDPDASAAFAEATSADLLDRRATDARVVRATIAPFLDGDAETIEIVVPTAEVDTWLRTLAALRLIIAARLGIETGEEHDPEDPRFGVYDWLGYRLDVLIAAADAADDDSTPSGH
ncbi:DUF2017 family protein [Microbacterium sp. ASV81]|uniref:DUF2017 family protein n=1 Tax=Microbacterium capsulatum TaxID=3041921 RepID=A0ABU0XBY7_9MICO|nr:DUF2017 family protein [Microbacterium sp. ASV81]MDQ4212627.1 DUF2017 family protein [Microbacterium sp. ASV81]